MRFKVGDIIVSPHYPKEYGYIQAIEKDSYIIVWSTNITIEESNWFGREFDSTLGQYDLHRLATLLYGD